MAEKLNASCLVLNVRRLSNVSSFTIHLGDQEVKSVSLNSSTIILRVILDPSLSNSICSFGHWETSATDCRRTFDACFHQGDRESNRREYHHSEVTTTRNTQTSYNRWMWHVLVRSRESGKKRWTIGSTCGAQSKEWRNHLSSTVRRNLAQARVYPQKMSKQVSGHAIGIYPVDCEKFPKDRLDKRLSERYDQWVELGKPQDIMEQLATSIHTPQKAQPPPKDSTDNNDGDHVSISTPVATSTPGPSTEPASACDPSSITYHWKWMWLPQL